MQTYRREFIEFLLANNALKFGEFTLKSGRISPYFFNLGTFNNGASLAKLGTFYADVMAQMDFQCDVLFGPAYKGIPLVSATAIAMYNKFQRTIPYCFNRKEAKDHGDGGMLVGAPLAGKVIMVDDVITAGTTVRETIKMMESYEAELGGIIIAFDRQERGIGERSAVQETVAKHGVPVQSIVTLDDVVEYLKEKSDMEEHLASIEMYRTEYGVTA